jgi:hypothetical protein
LILALPLHHPSGQPSVALPHACPGFLLWLNDLLAKKNFASGPLGHGKDSRDFYFLGAAGAYEWRSDYSLSAFSQSAEN